MFPTFSTGYIIDSYPGCRTTEKKIPVFAAGAVGEVIFAFLKPL
jgi:hypothetical protein